MTYTLTVLGEPAPQGSVRAFGNRVVQGGSKESRDRLGDWRRAIGDQARSLELVGLIDEPVTLTLAFFLQKPASTPKYRRWAWKKPDLDKLVRAALDALTGTLLTDDSRVVSITATKAYAIDCRPGCVLRVDLAAEDTAPWRTVSP